MDERVEEIVEHIVRQAYEHAKCDHSYQDYKKWLAKKAQDIAHEE